MLDWLRLLALIFYAPIPGMREVRDRASIAPAALIATLLNGGFLYYLTASYLISIGKISRPLAIVSVLLQSSGSLLFLSLVFVPLAVFLANVFERRGTFRLVI